MPNRSMNSALGPLRHGDLAHRCLGDILAWLSVLLASLRHGTPTTSTSVASSLSHYELVYLIVAVLGFVKFTWHELLLIIK